MASVMRMLSLSVMTSLCVVLALVCGSGAQWISPYTKVTNAKHVAEFLNRYCGDIASFLPAVCGAGITGPPCCSLHAIVDMCRPSCGGGQTGGAFGPNNRGIIAIMYDPNVCSDLMLTGRSQCQATGLTSVSCDRLSCLMNMLCYPTYNFVCYYRTTTDFNLGDSTNNGLDSSGPGGAGGGGDVGPGTLGNEGGGAARPGRNVTETIVCFELPEIANGETTGILGGEDRPLRICPHNAEEPNCKDKNKQRYRTIDGSCNNLEHPRWGKSFEPHKRILSPRYVNGNLPRNTSTSGQPLPNPRTISHTVSPDDMHTAPVSNMVMAWGQFIDHDFNGSPVIKNGTEVIKCCGDVEDAMLADNGGPCLPIQIPDNDTLGRQCMEFVRSVPASFPNGTQRTPRQQLISLTSFLDASAVYGNTQEVLDKIRLDDGFLNLTEKGMLPEGPSSSCKKVEEGDYCLFAGDHRVNVFVGLGTLHTAFAREHNRIAALLKEFNPTLDPEILFQETRRIVAAEFQHITYVEWLPLVLGQEAVNKYRLNEGDYRYDPKINPTIANVFSTAAFRFGHSQVKQHVVIGSDVMQLQDTLMRPTFVLNRLPDVVAGLLGAPTDVADRFFVDGLTAHLFETNSTAKDGLDLVAINIQRGRDHGLPPYNEYRDFCGLPPITSFQSPELTFDLGTVYSHPDDIDVFVGMITEAVVPGSLVGPTFACLMGVQFQEMKFGDRFFYETRNRDEKFTKDQLKQIKKVTLSKVICDNIPEMKKIQPNAFKVQGPGNKPEDCRKLPKINLKHWKSF